MGSDSQAFTAFGATGVDDGAATTGFHADQKAVGARTACFRGLVSAFHVDLCSSVWGNRGLSLIFKPLSEVSTAISDLLFKISASNVKIFLSVDKFLIKYPKCASKTNLSTV
jgi:hypothetical protein